MTGSIALLPAVCAAVEDLDVLPELAWRAVLEGWPDELTEPEVGRPPEDLVLLARLRRLEPETTWGKGPAPP